jgi:nucleotide-binding universal stress UspA family protein
MPTVEASTRITIKNVLFATDFSLAANNALRYAGELSRRSKAKLYAVHVQDAPNYALPPESWRSVAEASEIQARELREKVATAFPEIESEVLIAEGKTWQVLASLAEEKKIDLIVIGTRGRTGVGKFFLGSQAEEILRHAPCPVLVAGPYSYWSEHGGKKMSEVLYATDFGPNAQEAARYALSVAEEYQGHLTFLHVIEEPHPDELVNASQLQAASERKLHDLAPRESGSFVEPAFLVEQGSPAEKILEVAERIHADLIVLGVREASGIPGAATHLPIAVAHKVIAQADCPVLAIHTAGQHAAATA